MILPNLIGALVLTHANTNSAPQGTGVFKFSDAKIISKNSGINFRQGESFGGVTYSFLMFGDVSSSEKYGGTIVVLVPKGYKTFNAELGVSDDKAYNETWTIPSSYVISLDEKEVRKGELEPRAKPSRFSLDVSEAKILKIELFQAAGLGDPVFSKSAPEVSTKAPLLTPDNKAEVSGSEVILKWGSVRGAVSYAVEVVNTSWDVADSNTPRIWSFTTKDTKHAFQLKGLPKGKYRWSVICFGANKVLGEWSNERSFTLID